jgi:hypothetical protein
VKSTSSKKTSTSKKNSSNSIETVTHRTVPIKESITTIGAGYPDKLVLFQIPASKFWWCRYYTGKKIVKKSTKTENKTEAIRFAKKFYEDILLRERNLLPIGKSASFERFAQELLLEQEQLIKRGERNPLMNINDRQKLNHDLLPYFKDYKISEINYKIINNFIDQLASRNLSPSSIKNHLNLLHKILQLAARENAITNIPEFPKVRLKDSPRAWFNNKEYELLKKTTERLIIEKEIVRGHPITKEMNLLITFMVNSFLRPSDLKELRHRNIQVVKEDNLYLRIQPEMSKTENSPIVTMEAAVGIYEDLIEFQKSENRGIRKEDFVFFPHLKGENSNKKKGKDKTNRDYALQTIRRQFELILERADLKTASSGEPRTLYSLRHTAIMFRLTLGDKIDSLTLAKNARTSVEMLERFYARHLQPEMNIEKLQSTKKRKMTKTVKKNN